MSSDTRLANEAWESMFARMILTPEGTRIQKLVGRRYAVAVTSTITRALTRQQLEQLRDISPRIASAIDPSIPKLESTQIST